MIPLLLGITLAAAQTPTPDHGSARARMVAQDLLPRGITDTRVLRAMSTVPREEFVPAELRMEAYADRPLPIGPQATISQPYIVARMTELADVQPGDKVLEVGTGSGYQAAVLHSLGARVWTIELNPDLARGASRALRKTGHEEVQVIVGDGYDGYPKHAPYDAIVVTAAPPEVPKALMEQLAEGGLMVIPVGKDQQVLRLIRRRDGVLERRDITPVRFVPLRPR